MLYVLGAGAAFPETVVDTDLLAALGVSGAAEFEGRFGIRSRRSSLSRSYLEQTKNSEPRQSKSGAIKSPTALAVEAVRGALERAGITPEQIGTLIADCSTPYQLCPAEAQRISEQFGFRLPSYDLTEGGGVIPFHIDTVSQWQESRISEYMVLTATNTPTQRCAYDAGANGELLLGDAAAALVVSSTHRGKLALVDSFSAIDVRAGELLSFDIYDKATIDLEAFLGKASEHAREMTWQALSRNHLSGRKIIFIGPGLSARLQQDLIENFHISPERSWDLLQTHGHMVGSTTGAVLAHHWGDIRAGDIIVAVQVTVGMSYGYAVFEAVGG